MNPKQLDLSQDELAQVANALAANLRIGDIILFKGDLGAGKTFFCSKLVKALGLVNEQPVTSPTFNLVHTYDTSKGTVWHYDLYRLKDPHEAQELAMDDAFNFGITLIEWPQIIESHIKPPFISVMLTQGSASHLRNVEITHHLIGE